MAHEPMLVLDSHGRFVQGNAAFAQTFGAHVAKAGQRLEELEGSQWRDPALGHMLAELRGAPDRVASAELLDDRGWRSKINARQIAVPGSPPMLVLAFAHAPTPPEAAARSPLADVTAQLGTERAHMASLLDNAPIGIAFFDRTHRYVKINNFLAALNGTPAAAHHQASINTLPPLNIQTFGPLIDQVFTEHKPVLNREFTSETLARPGVRRYWLTSFYPVTEPDTLATNYVGMIVTEISERKRNEELMRISASRLAIAQRAGQLGTFEWNVQKNSMLWTPELEALYGLKPGTFEGTYDSWLLRIHPDDHAAVHANVSSALAGGLPYDVEFRVRWPDGTERWMLAKGDVLFDQRGTAERMIGINIDITERRQVVSALAERRQQLELALDAASMGAWQWDMASRSLICNSGCKAHFGFAPDEQVAADRLIARLTPEDFQRFRDDMRRTIENDQPYDGEFRVQWPDGSTHWLRITGRLMHHAEQAAYGLVGITLDVTATRAMFDEHANILAREQAALAETQQALRLRDEFLLVASHELKTPLTSMLGNAQLLQRRISRDVNISPANHKALGVLVNQARRLERMINDLLDITRISKGRLSIDAQRFDLTKLVRQVVEEIQPTLYLSHTVVINLCHAPMMIEGDPLRLEQVLQNLIQNALKYSPNGGRIEVRVEAIGEQARISVIDEGLGIPAGAQPLLFSQFYRASNVRLQQISGMGIGLYVVKEIVAMHHGTVRVESHEGKGSTFMIDLPLSATPPLTLPDPS